MLFVYKRLETTKATITALMSNHLASSSDLIVFSDGAKNAIDSESVESIRNYLKSLSGFNSISIRCSPVNKGLAASVIDGVTQIIEERGAVIVLEDDILAAPNFLDFMNQALDFYKNNASIFAISGFSYPMKSVDKSIHDALFSYRSYSWGWATWQSRWQTVDWDVKDFDEYRQDRHRIAKFRRGGSDLPPMLRKQRKGLIDSWMIRWVYTQSKLNQLDVFPKISKVQNLGFGNAATNTRYSGRRYRTIIDAGHQRAFNFNGAALISDSVQREWEWLHSYPRRLWYRFLNLLPFLH